MLRESMILIQIIIDGLMIMIIMDNKYCLTNEITVRLKMAKQNLV